MVKGKTPQPVRQHGTGVTVHKKGANSGSFRLPEFVLALTSVDDVIRIVPSEDCVLFGVSAPRAEANGLKSFRIREHLAWIPRDGQATGADHLGEFVGRDSAYVGFSHLVLHKEHYALSPPATAGAGVIPGVTVNKKEASSESQKLPEPALDRPQNRHSHSHSSSMHPQSVHTPAAWRASTSMRASTSSGSRGMVRRQVQTTPKSPYWAGQVHTVTSLISSPPFRSRNQGITTLLWSFPASAGE